MSAPASHVVWDHGDAFWATVEGSRVTIGSGWAEVGGHSHVDEGQRSFQRPPGRTIAVFLDRHGALQFTPGFSFPEDSTPLWSITAEGEAVDQRRLGARPRRTP